ncbi:MAG TPA: protein kinase, partial [Gemmataceae bacterium]|nr:protein kinase [Gemmataceae bacterium]
MSTLPPTGDAPLSRLLDEVCDRFEAAWKAAHPRSGSPAGARPLIEEYLADIPGPQRLTLLRELILLEVDYRRRAGDGPCPEEYLARFPELDTAWLGAALGTGAPVTRQADGTAAWVPTQPPTRPQGHSDGEPQPVPPTVGGYRILRPLGGGGMGTVYEAEEAATGRHVALKFLAPELADSPDAITRFRAESQLASGISHPRCVFVLAADEEAGRPYIVMELMPGDTLADLVKRQGPLPPGQAVACILDVLDGLMEAHRVGIIHRDVKPSNCFLTADGRVKVGDFGLAKSLVRSAHLTRTGTFLGTPLYASPEQIKGQGVDPRTDIYSLAATLYYLLAGKAPFEGGDALAVMAQVVSEPPPPVRGQRPDVPPGLERVLLSGLERDRDRRPQSLEEFRAALLPFAPQGSNAGAPGWRFAAYLLDSFLFALLGTDVGLLGLLARWHGSAAEKQTLFLVSNGLWLVSITLLEGRWGWSPGKLLLGLRVWAADDSEPPGVARALVRTVAHFSIVFLAASVVTLVSYGDPGLWWYEFVGVLLTLLGSLLLLSTMRKRNGYRGPHEFLSGTRVVRLPRTEAEDLLAGRPARALAGTARPP